MVVVINPYGMVQQSAFIIYQLCKLKIKAKGRLVCLLISTFIVYRHLTSLERHELEVKTSKIHNINFIINFTRHLLQFQILTVQIANISSGYNYFQDLPAAHQYLSY